VSTPRPLDVLLLCHDTLVPPPGARGYARRSPPEWRTEFDVARALRALGHRVAIAGVQHDVEELLRAVRAHRPDVVFNLLVEFHSNPGFDQHVASLLELLELPYTGCNPRGLTLARDKALSKEILAAHGVDVPRFQVFERDARPAHARLPFPQIVKSRTEEASLGLARASLVRDPRALARRVAFVHERLGTDAIAEEYLDGRELYSAVLDGPRPRVLPTWELVLARRPRTQPLIATRAVKFSAAVQRRLGVRSRAARLPPALERRVVATARATWRALGLSGYARIDLRLTSTGRLAVLEANPNPELARGEDFADAARAAGLPYPALVQCLLALARNRATSPLA
jgi:D-alanine-D-alanine ligase